MGDKFRRARRADRQIQTRLFVFLRRNPAARIVGSTAFPLLRLRRGIVGRRDHKQIAPFICPRGDAADIVDGGRQRGDSESLRVIHHADDQARLP